ncbi:MAG: asparagine synthase (glutamine-hydrolyzing) [Gemmatimonadetes bacterium]|nr:asparagine synthase (glutamine-hydrolyzing) [Gemmatimonadota bacterium]
MCGIAGVAHTDGRPVPAALVERLCAALRHRGPDDRGMFVDGPVGLGMQRLSIIDLAGGRQPVFNEDRTKVIVFNGEIYNYRELRRELIGRGHEFRSASDTETILHLYEDSGPSCVERLRGMFAFAIWDQQARTLFLARDRFGIKPLYVLRAPWGLAFASELKALHAAGFTDGRLDWEALDAFFQLGYVPAPATPFRHVKKLEPGHTLLWQQRGDVTVRRYWDLPENVVAEPPEVERWVREWLDESISAHLVSDVPVAAFLSGGLDSSAVVASMGLRGERPHAFTARYLGSGAAGTDESRLAAALAERYGARLTTVEIQPEIASTFEEIVYALDEPHADDSAVPTWALSKIVGGSYKVALTGIGGDELFAGYWRHTGMLLGDTYSRLPRPLQRVASAAAQVLHEPRDGGLGIDRAKRFLRTGTVDFADRFLGYVNRLQESDRTTLYAPALRGALQEEAARDRFRKLYLRGGCRGGLAGSLYLDYKTYLPDDVLALSDRLAMAHSLEIRVPFVDHELVERVFSLPDHSKVRWGIKKLLLKRALRTRLTRAHLRAPKRGFVGPTGPWLRGELRPMVEDELSAERVARLGYFNPETVTRLLKEHFDRRHNHERILWGLLCFSTWHRLYVERGAPRPYVPEGRAERTSTVSS